MDDIYRRQIQIFIFVLSITFLCLSYDLFAQTLTPTRLVDAPTAGSIPGKSLLMETCLFDGGGVVQTIGIGVTELLGVGVSYGGAGIVGAGKVTWQPHVAFQVRVRIIEETERNPALAIGFDSQGFGPFARGSNLNRFRTKSRGAYLVLSRNYKLFGDLGFHGGVNFSLETDDGDEDPSFWAGIDKNIGSNFDICAEYDFATNDNEDETITADRGYLNGAVKWHIGTAFMLELDVKNILRNTKKDIAGFIDERPEPSRELRFTYRRSF
ncbi:MAG: hypothetical protein JXB48_04205 [Candidatus Latescibacteria bacterium]|nr:hypothetical protein [Candidatus Latescibacterota bacterium]